MNSYSINVITNDFVEILLNYPYSYFVDVDYKIKELLKENMNINIFKNIYKESAYLSLLAESCLMDIYEIDEKEELNIIDSLPIGIRILNKKKDEDFIVVLSLARLDTNYKFKLPKYKDVLDYAKEMKFTPNYEIIINHMLLEKGYKEEKEEEISSNSSILYLDIYGKEENILDKNDFDYDEEISGKKKGDSIRLINHLMNERVEEHKIVRVASVKAKELDEKIVKELNYKGAKTKDEFTALFIKDYDKVFSFLHIIASCYEKLVSSNPSLFISKYLFDLFDNNLENDLLKEESKERKYDIIRCKILEAYIDKYLYKEENIKRIDTTYLNKYFKCEFDITSLINNTHLKESDFNEYLENRQFDAALYTMIKSGGNYYDK